MLGLWTEIKRRFATFGWALLAALGSLALAVAYLFSRRTKERTRSPTLDPMLAHFSERVAAANARAAVEVHAAETKEQGVRDELAEIGRDPDGPNRRRRLIELAARIDGTKP